MVRECVPKCLEYLPIDAEVTPVPIWEGPSVCEIRGTVGQLPLSTTDTYCQMKLESNVILVSFRHYRF